MAYEWGKQWSAIAVTCVALAWAGCSDEIPDEVPDGSVAIPDGSRGDGGLIVVVQDADRPDPRLDVGQDFRADALDASDVPDAQLCPRNQTECGARCANTDEDFFHCGRCGNECAQDQSCSAGTCGPPSDTTPARFWAQCPSGRCVGGAICVPDPRLGTRTCTKSCSDDDDCLDTARCIDIGGGNSRTCFDLCDNGQACPRTTICQAPAAAFPNATATGPRLCAPPRAGG